MAEVRWGVIGAGDVCERKSGPPLYRVQRSQLTLVHRRDRERGEDFARRHAGRYVETLAELVESPEVDAIYVASPHELHAEHTIRALQAGKHVLVEKPMALSADDCRSMIEASRKANRSLGVAYYRRGYPSIIRLKKLLGESVVGPVSRMSINSEFPTSHRLDLVHYLLGNIDSVRLVPGSTTGYRFERSAGKIQVRSGDAVTTLTDTWTETGMREELLIRGSEGVVHLTDLKGGRIVVEKGTDRDQIDVEGLPFTHWGLIENFVAHLLDGERLLCDGPEGRRSTVVLDALGEADAALGEADEGSAETWYPITY